MAINYVRVRHSNGAEDMVPESTAAARQKAGQLQILDPTPTRYRKIPVPVEPVVVQPLAGPAAMKLAELKDFAAERGIDLGSATKKADVLAVIEAAAAEPPQVLEGTESPKHTEVSTSVDADSAPDGATDEPEEAAE